MLRYRLMICPHGHIMKIKLEGDFMQFTNICGHTVWEDDNFCGSCGARIPWPVGHFIKGMRVRYIPLHAHGDTLHKDCQDGVVSSTNDKFVFVKYDNAVMKMITGNEPYTSQATDPSDLILWKSFNRGVNNG